MAVNGGFLICDRCGTFVVVPEGFRRPGPTITDERVRADLADQGWTRDSMERDRCPVCTVIDA